MFLQFSNGSDRPRKKKVEWIETCFKVGEENEKLWVSWLEFLAFQLWFIVPMINVRVLFLTSQGFFRRKNIYLSFKGHRALVSCKSWLKTQENWREHRRKNHKIPTLITAEFSALSSFFILLRTQKATIKYFRIIKEVILYNGSDFFVIYPALSDESVRNKKKTKGITGFLSLSQRRKMCEWKICHFKRMIDDFNSSRPFLKNHICKHMWWHDKYVVNYQTRTFFSAHPRKKFYFHPKKY